MPIVDPPTEGIIEEFLHTPIPADLWHYTTLKALEGILSSGRIWATEVHFTTDKSEFVHAREIAEEYLASIPTVDDQTRRAKEVTLSVMHSAFEEGALSTSSTEIFVASFSSAPDLKSQWMEYADSGKGVSIAFGLSATRPPRGLGIGVTLAPCVYAKEKKEMLIQAALSHINDVAIDLWKKTDDQEWISRRYQNRRIVDRIFNLEFDREAFQAETEKWIGEQLHIAQIHSTFDLLRVASHCKDNSFRQEEEWRLALPHTKSKPLLNDKVLYRGPNSDIPYIAHNLFHERLPITQVMMGPFCESSSRIEQTLNDHGYAVPITKSAIPLRRQS